MRDDTPSAPPAVPVAPDHSRPATGTGAPAAGALPGAAPAAKAGAAHRIDPARAARLEAALVALRLQLFNAGMVYASWGVEIPAVKQRHGLGEQALSYALLAAGLGTIAAISLAPRLITRVGERTLARVSGVVVMLTLALVMLLPHYAGLLALMLAFGICAGLYDVAVNAQATVIEQALGRPVMSGLHAWFSTGGLVGAGAGAGLLALGTGPAGHLALVAVAGLAIAILGTPAMLPHPGPDVVAPATAAGAPAPCDAATRPAMPGAAAPAAPMGARRLPAALLLLGLVGASALVVEGAMYDWSVLLLAQVHGAPQALAALAFAAFSAAMAAGRFGGDALRARLDATTVLQASGLLACAGLVLLLAPWPATWATPLALAGCVLSGLGLANAVPVLFAAAGRVPGVAPAAGIATVSALGYAGLMIGPPLVGFVAQRAGLVGGLWVVAGFALLTAMLARPSLRADAPLARTD